MSRAQALIGLALLWSTTAAAAEPPRAYADAGGRALEFVASAVAFGPRPAGSEAQRKQQAWILSELRKLDCRVEEFDFQALTPLGTRSMKNIVAKFGQGERATVVSGHYDTYHRPDMRFVGANDGGSSTGFLLALGALLEKRELKNEVWLTFFDGEESVVAWQGRDHTYGSRRQTAEWRRTGDDRRIQALINVDMIGDADLKIEYESYSTAWLRDLIVGTAHELGYVDHFRSGPAQYVEDDHVPFLKAGYAAADLIDFRFGLLNRYWHTEADTLDKLSARSLAIVLHVVDESLKRIEQRIE